MSVQLAEIELTEQDLEEKKLHLMNVKIAKDDTDISLAEMEAQLEINLPNRFLEDSIKELQEDIKNRKCKRNRGNYEVVTDATDADMDLMKIKLDSLKKMKKLDIPMRDLRFKILDLKYKKKRMDAPENQIKKLEREIRERKATVPASRVNTTQPMGVG